MGLDIYLYRCPDWDTALKREAEYESGSSAIWDEVSGDRKYEQLSQTEKDDASRRTKELAAKLGLGEWGEDPSRQKIEYPSTIDPEHYCKVGYLRSSYNEGGFDRITANALGVSGFYHIFGRDRGDDYYFVPDWAASKSRAVEVAAQLASAKYRVIECSPNIFGDPLAGPDSERAAYEIVAQEMRRGAKGSYSSGVGDFFFDEPLRLRALITGTTSKLLLAGQRPRQCVYAVYESDIDWYVKAAKIAAETCDFVLGQPKPGEFKLAWSS